MTPEEIKTIKAIAEDNDTQSVYMIIGKKGKNYQVYDTMDTATFMLILINACACNEDLALILKEVVKTAELEAKLKSMKKKEQQRLEDGQNSELN